MSSLGKLNFRIVSCTSEDHDFPVSELLKHGPQTKGWQSARFQDYPQIIVFQFTCPVHIQQVQILSHQSKISSRIELYTYLPDNPVTLPPVEQYKWKRLGYIPLDDNEKSEYQARELKSVFIDVRTLFLKLVFNKCHTNKHNMFNQVGLIAISILGENAPEIYARRNPLARLESTQNFDPATNDRLSALIASKNKAVENEDFDEAKRLREAIERLKSIGSQLLNLEERKKIAVQNEDYDSAKLIKLEIERLRFGPDPNYLARSVPANSQPLGLGRSFSRTGLTQASSDYAGSKKNIKSEVYDTSRNGNNKDYYTDERAIPALSNRKNGAGGYEEDNQAKNNSKTLGYGNEKLKKDFVGILDEETRIKILSKTWDFNEDDLDSLVEQALNGFISPDPDTRSSSYNLLIYIYSNTGEILLDRIRELKILKPTQIEVLKRGFSDTEVLNTQDKDNIMNKNAPNTSNMCNFCGKTENIFENQDNLDIHYWKDCPMLVACSQCSQIVDILQLNTHMLKECELSELVGQCPRCKEAIHMDEYEQHVEEQACLPAKPPSKANRCPLCHDDVEPGHLGWIKHIITEGCPNNDRSNY
jgi:XRCC1 N terminal domain/UvrB/uvrC motif